MQIQSKQEQRRDFNDQECEINNLKEIKIDD